MIQKNKNSLSIWFFENLLRYREICHFVSDRSGGFSDPPYEFLNLGFHVGDDTQKVLKNRELLASAFEFSADDFVTPEQVHGGNVAVITQKNCNLSATDYKSTIKATDAMVTNVSGIYLMILLADCVPILFYDPKKQVIGIAHAGWGGVVNKIAENTVNTMRRRYSSTPEDIIVGIGPSIGPCCYEVKLDVIEKVRRNLNSYNEVIISMNNKYYLDLWKANKIQLLNSGISKENIELSGICTKCSSNIFFSARAYQGKTGRFGVGIMIRN